MDDICERYRILSDMTSDYSFVIRVDSGGHQILEWANQAFLQITGLKPDKMDKDESLLKVIYPDDVIIAKQRENRLLSGLPDVSEFRILNKNGDVRWVRMHGFPEWDENHSRVKYIFSAAQDITEHKLIETALIQSEQKYRVLVNNLPDVIARFDRDLRHIYVSPSIEKITGLAPETFVGKTNRELGFNEEALALWDGALQRVFETGQEEQIEFSFHGKQGVRFFESLIVPEYALDGVVATVLSVAREVTENKKAQETLQEHEKLLRAALNNSPDTIYIVDLITGKVEFLNREEFCGYSREELEGKNSILFAIHPDDLERVKENWQRLITGNEIFPIEFRLQKKGGGLEWIEQRVSVLSRNPDNSARQLLVTLGIITRRRLGEEALKAERERFLNVLEIMPIMVCLLSPDYRIPFANRAFREKFGDLNDKPCYQGCFGQDKPCDFCETFQVLKTGKPHRWECTSLDGRILDVFDFPFADLDGTNQILEVVVDISDRKNVEEVLRQTSLYHRSLIEANLDPLVTIDSYGKITDVNHATEIAMGYAREQLIDTDFSEYFTEPEKAKAGYLKVFAEGNIRDYPLELKHPDGHSISVLYNASIYKDEKGQVMGVFAAARDITERKLAEEARRQSEQKYHLLYENMEQGVAFYASNGRMVSANPAAQKMFGLSNEQMANLSEVGPIHDAIHEDGSPFPAAERPIIFSLKSGKPVDDSVMGIILSENSDVIWINENTVPLFRPGEAQPYQVFATFDDITDRRRSEREIQNLLHSVTDQREDLRAMAARLSEVEEIERRKLASELHDQVGQNLTALGVSLNIIRNRVGAVATADALKRIDDAQRIVEQATERIRDVMADLRPALLDDYGLLATLRWYARQFSQRTGVEVVVKANVEPLPRLTPSVETSLYRITQEALNNVIKHAHAKQVRLVLGVKNGELKLTISDNGLGFDPKNIMVDGKRPGWGLTIMRERIEAAGGRLEITSKPGKGTKINVILALQV